ncbi:MAG: hypothetical protein AAF682_27510 [Planctomycetota bacterium]
MRYAPLAAEAEAAVEAGGYRRAEEQLRKPHRESREELGPGHATTLRLCSEVAWACFAANRHREVLPFLEEAVALAADEMPEDEELRLRLQHQLGVALTYCADFARAGELLAAVSKEYERDLGPTIAERSPSGTRMRRGCTPPTGSRPRLPLSETE